MVIPEPEKQNITLSPDLMVLLRIWSLTATKCELLAVLPRCLMLLTTIPCRFLPNSWATSLRPSLMLVLEV